jgi:hypothetical protein
MRFRPSNETSDFLHNLATDNSDEATLAGSSLSAYGTSEAKRRGYEADALARDTVAPFQAYGQILRAQNTPQRSSGSNSANAGKLVSAGADLIKGIGGLLGGGGGGVSSWGLSGPSGAVSYSGGAGDALSDWKIGSTDWSGIGGSFGWN